MTVTAVGLPANPQYAGIITHMYGTIEARSDPTTHGLRPDCRHHHLGGLYAAARSVFSGKTGAKPQPATPALATPCGRVVAAE